VKVEIVVPIIDDVSKILLANSEELFTFNTTPASIVGSVVKISYFSRPTVYDESKTSVRTGYIKRKKLIYLVGIVSVMAC
jgi:hypothetical protein